MCIHLRDACVDFCHPPFRACVLGGKVCRNQVRQRLLKRLELAELDAEVCWKEVQGLQGFILHGSSKYEHALDGRIWGEK